MVKKINLLIGLLLGLSSAIAIAMALFFMNITSYIAVGSLTCIVISFLILLVITYVDNKKISLFKITILAVLTGLISIGVRVIEDTKYSKLINTLLYAFVIINILNKIYNLYSVKKNKTY